MKNHVIVLAVLCFLATVFWAIGGLVALGALTLGAFFVQDPVGSPLMVAGGVVAGGGLLLFGLFHGIAGFGLLQERNWARWIVIVFSVFHLFNPPVGTILGLYGLWVLFHADTRVLFEAA